MRGRGGGKCQGLIVCVGLTRGQQATPSAFQTATLRPYTVSSIELALLPFRFRKEVPGETLRRRVMWPHHGGSQSRCQQPRVSHQTHGWCSLGRFHSKEACDARVNLRSVLVSPWLMWPRPPGGAKGWASSSVMSNRRPVTITRISPRHGTCPSALLTLSPIAIHKLVWNHRTDAKTTGSSTSRDDKKGETTGIEPRSVYISVETLVCRLQTRCLTHRRQTNEGKETGRK